MITPPRGRVQVVLRHNPLSQIWRLMWALVAASRHAIEARLLTSLELALGDCSQQPLPGPDVDDLSHHGSNAGLDVTYRFFDENLGHSGGHNRLASNAAAEILVFANPDTYPSPTSLSELVAVLGDRRIGIAEARQIPFEHPKAFDLDTGDTSWASGAFLTIWRSVFEQVGGFSPEYFPLHCDDVDLSWRVALAGFRIVHVPNATVFHDKRPDLSGYPQPTGTESYHSTLGRLMLCVRYSNRRVLEQTIEHIRSAGTDEQTAALREFEVRQLAGSLPPPLPGGERVAQFVGGEYAEHRF